MYLFPWGKKGTLLEKHQGPDYWQKEQLISISEELKKGATVQEAISSGHGIGKSAECAWLIIALMSLRPHLRGVVTANTQTQLTTKTWAELAVWHKMAINSHWFKWTATKFSHVQHEETWFVSAIPQNEHNSEAFAGLHAKYVLVIFDEASAIPDKIWEVTEGAMTTPEAVWVVFGNPTKNSGRFRDCFKGGKFSHRWKNKKVDSRSAKMADKNKIKQWEEDYGEDSDFFRVRVKGEFPRASANQFISSGIVQECQIRELEPRQFAQYPIVIGVDVAREGDDRSVIFKRQGGKLFEPEIYRGLDTMQLASKVIDLFQKTRAQVIFVDGIGIGAGVVDRLKHLKFPVVDVVVSNSSTSPREYANLRAEIWGNMRDWLANADTSIPNLTELKDELVGIEYGYNAKFQILLESKKDYKKRTGESPDIADALALTFAPFKPKKLRDSRLMNGNRQQNNANPAGWT